MHRSNILFSPRFMLFSILFPHPFGQKGSWENSEAAEEDTSKQGSRQVEYLCVGISQILLLIFGAFNVLELPAMKINHICKCPAWEWKHVTTLTRLIFDISKSLRDIFVLVKRKMNASFRFRFRCSGSSIAGRAGTIKSGRFNGPPASIDRSIPLVLSAQLSSNAHCRNLEFRQMPMQNATHFVAGSLESNSGNNGEKNPFAENVSPLLDDFFSVWNLLCECWKPFRQRRCLPVYAPCFSPLLFRVTICDGMRGGDSTNAQSSTLSPSLSLFTK